MGFPWQCDCRTPCYVDHKLAYLPWQIFHTPSCFNGNHIKTELIKWTTIQCRTNNFLSSFWYIINLSGRDEKSLHNMYPKYILIWNITGCSRFELVFRGLFILFLFVRVGIELNFLEKCFQFWAAQRVVTYIWVSESSGFESPCLCTRRNFWLKS